MHTVEEEFYVFLRFADGDFLQALTALDHLPKVESDFLRLCLIKDAAMSYCRPFKRSKGAFSKSLKLDENFVPDHLLSLHKELLALRDQVFAHTDIEVRSAVLHCWTRNPKLIFPIQFKSHHYPQLLERGQEMRMLFDAVLISVREKQTECEVKFCDLILSQDVSDIGSP